MSAVRNKARNTAQAAKGKIQQSAGKTTKNRKTQAKGTANRAAAKVKNAGERAKDRLR